MGNSPSGRAEGGILHASLQRSKSIGRGTKSLRSARSVRRVSNLFSMRAKDVVSTREPSEKMPSNIEIEFEIVPVQLKMQRNLCSCIHPLVRVDIVTNLMDELTRRRLFVARRVTLNAHADVLRVVKRDLVIHCYLAHQWMVATPNHHQHPHLVTLLGHFLQEQTFHVLTDYYALGSLQSMLSPDKSSSFKKSTQFQQELAIRDAVRQLCAAIAFMHEEGIVHTDLCLENIFVDAVSAVHVGDFRHAIFIGKTRQRRRIPPPPIRPAYAAPELYTGREVDLLKVDAWSLGITIAMLLTKKTPVEEATARDCHYRQLQVLGVPRFLEKLMKGSDAATQIVVTPTIREIVELLAALLECEPDKRISVIDATRRFPWLQMNLRPPEVVSVAPSTQITDRTQPHKPSGRVASDATVRETTPETDT